MVCCQPGRGLPRTPDANSTPACVRLNDADEPQLFRWPSRGELPEGKSPKLGRGTFRQGRAARKKPSPWNRREARHKRRGPPSVRPAVFHACRPAPPLWQGSRHAAARWGTLRPPRHTAERLDSRPDRHPASGESMHRTAHASNLSYASYHRSCYLLVPPQRLKSMDASRAETSMSPRGDVSALLAPASPSRCSSRGTGPSP